MGDVVGAHGDRAWRERELERLIASYPRMLERMNQPPEVGPRFFTLAEQGRLLLALRHALAGRHEARLACKLIAQERDELRSQLASHGPEPDGLSHGTDTPPAEHDRG